jgi:hypothetical protein
MAENRPQDGIEAAAPRTIAIAASAGSVTRSGRPIPSERHISGSSAIRPAPKRIAVG